MKYELLIASCKAVYIEGTIVQTIKKRQTHVA